VFKCIDEQDATEN
jgi:hypothetical protein